jgi:hypothetical protein
MNKEKFKEFKKDLNKFKKNLIKKAKEKGLYENFGQTEISKLNDKYSLYCITLYEDFGKEINLLFDNFKEFCSNYSDKELSEVLEE